MAVISRRVTAIEIPRLLNASTGRTQPLISILGGARRALYFGKPSRISHRRSASVGHDPQPNNYPLRPPDLALSRRNLVLGLMLRNQKIKDRTREALKTPLPRTRSDAADCRPSRSTSPACAERRALRHQGLKGRGCRSTPIDLDAHYAAARTAKRASPRWSAQPPAAPRDQPLQGALIKWTRAG